MRVVKEEIALASERELLREKSFAQMTEEELAAIAALMRRLRFAPPKRRTRRRESARAGSPDLRRTLRRSFRTGGEPIDRAWRERRRKPRRLVLLLDVSGSMADYSRALLLFAHAALRTDARWEAFCFGTRLTRVTNALARADPDDALRRASASPPRRQGPVRRCRVRLRRPQPRVSARVWRSLERAPAWLPARYRRRSIL